MSDYRVEVKVQFTIDVMAVNMDDARDIAKRITKATMNTHFNRAHLIDIYAPGVLDITEETD